MKKNQKNLKIYWTSWEDGSKNWKIQREKKERKTAIKIFQQTDQVSWEKKNKTGI